jgi:cold shock CspA family protein
VIAMMTVTGKVRFYNAREGFGFISSPDVAGDIYVHHSIVEDTGRAALSARTEVECEVKRGESGKWRATRLIVLSEPRYE